MDARNLGRLEPGRNRRGRAILRLLPPRPHSDARLSRFTSLLDTIAVGERCLDSARQAVESDNPAGAARELSRFLTLAKPALAQTEDLPAEYVTLLGRTVTRALVARAGAWIEQWFAGEQAIDALRSAARADMAQVFGLPAAWLDAQTRAALSRLQRVLEIAPT